jgi:leucyl aminopeptidase
MEIKVVVGDIATQQVDAILVNLFEGLEHPGGATAAVDKALDGAISQLIADGEIKGKLNEITVIHTLGKILPKRVIVIGLGKQADLKTNRIRSVIASACREMRSLGVKRAATIVHGAGAGGIASEKAAQVIAEGAIMGLYTFRRHMSEKPDSASKEIDELLIVERDQSKVAELERGIRCGRIISQAANMTRDMVNEPANYMTPSDMAEVAHRLAGEQGLECTILEKEEMARMGMGGLIGVAQGSVQPPKFIILKYKGDPASKKTLGLVGKGITFDSGGISIKPSEGMGEMKGDMAGGATVMSVIKAIAELKLKLNVTALIPATENLPSGSAIKPGDVLKALNGKTIEIISTDAEGRLILADALSYGRKLELSPMIDVATLTGACHIALGDYCSGAFTNNQELVDKLINAGKSAGEYVWQMPMFEEYKEQNRSDVADVKNSGGRYGGAITAAQFLAEFSEDTPWVHLDIAGTDRAESNRGHLVKGATGVMVSTLINLAQDLAAAS